MPTYRSILQKMFLIKNNKGFTALRPHHHSDIPNEYARFDQQLDHTSTTQKMLLQHPNTICWLYHPNTKISTEDPSIHIFTKSFH